MVKEKIITRFLSAFVCILLILILAFGDDVSSAVRESLYAVAFSIIPALFPYMVFSSVIISFDLLEPIYKHLPTEKIFCLPRVSASVIITGLMCGFPVGASGACNLVRQGKITKSEASRLCAVSSNTSPAFIMGVIGSVWGWQYGVFLLTVQTASSVLLGAILRNIYKNKYREKSVDTVLPVETKITLWGTVCKAVSESSASCLSICGYIVFFRVLTVIFARLIPNLSSILSALFEFSSGCRLGAEEGGIYGLCLVGFAVGFSGFSVFMQILNITEPYSVPFSATLITKIIQGVLMSASSAVFYLLFSPSPSLQTLSNIGDRPLGWAILILMIVLLCFLLSGRATRRKYFM